MAGSSFVARASPAPVHSTTFRWRRFFNWFPLGLTYATYYMGRYNFVKVKSDLGIDPDIVLGIAFWVYALAVSINGPLTDKIGGRKSIIIGALGAAVSNAVMGAYLLGGVTAHAQLFFTIAYCANMYFQSFGALSVVKVNAPWFHVTERGLQGGIFGIMISLGYALAFAVGGIILAYLPPAYIFIVPSTVLFAIAAVDFLIVRESPSKAGYTDFDTGDAGGDPNEKFKVKDVLIKIFTNRVIVLLGFAEFCTGFVRQGLLTRFGDFLLAKHGVPKHSSDLYSLAFWANWAPTVGGIAGGLLCGWLSDRLFDSRRPPVAFIFYVAQIITLLTVGYAPSAGLAAFLVGLSCAWIFGVHGMLSGTASADFGGKKAAATATGFLDGIQYVGGGLAMFALKIVIGVPATRWHLWTWALIPFSVIGGGIMLTLWNEKPRRASAPQPATEATPAVDLGGAT